MPDKTVLEILKEQSDFIPVKRLSQLLEKDESMTRTMVSELVGQGLIELGHFSGSRMTVRITAKGRDSIAPPRKEEEEGIIEAGHNDEHIESPNETKQNIGKSNTSQQANKDMRLAVYTAIIIIILITGYYCFRKHIL